MASLRVRWSEHEARKPYARPFGVSFVDDAGEMLGSVAVSGSELLYLRHFQVAVLALTGELFSDSAIAEAQDPQREWLDRIGALIPALPDFTVAPSSHFADQSGRVFRFNVIVDGAVRCAVDAPTLVEYQEFQASIAHQTGALCRIAPVEDHQEQAARQLAWWDVLREHVRRPAEDDAIAPTWPWQ